ncbi:MAG: carboxypeptidase-like regulatory domain-containing protein, partial [Chitinophagaceae bacterium]
MAKDNNIKTFTAVDIEKYHKGLLSANEMHAIEKAALDDPFLADALEGYASAVNVDADVAELRSRLAKRTEEENKAVPVATGQTVSFYWWKVAAMFVLIAGAGLIVYRLGFTDKKNDLAQSVSKETESATTKDSGSSVASPTINTDTNASSTATAGQKNNLIKAEDQKDVSTSLSKEKAGEKNTNPEIAKEIEAAEAPTLRTVTPGVALEKNKEKEEAFNDDSQKKISAAKQEGLKARRQDNEVAGIGREAEQKRNVAAQNQPVENNLYKKAQERKAINQANVFRGRVTDTHDNALPFSNITNLDDSIGTYSDARGYFILTSPDSVLNVQVRSLGFESNNVQLQNNVPNNPVQLQEDRSSLAEVVISNKKPNSNRARDGNMVLQEPEPADGWSNYDIYLANNLKVPGVFKAKPPGTTGEVELSFDIDKNGEPINITVKKSLCESCDKEAIRLVKEGPK